MTTVLYSQKATFNEHNAALFFTLGLASTAVALLDELADGQTNGVERQPVQPASTSEDDDNYLLCLLGMVAFSTEVARLIEVERCRVMGAHPVQQTQEPSDSEVTLPPLLR